MPFFASVIVLKIGSGIWTGRLSWMALGSSAGVNKLICSSIDNKVLRLSYNYTTNPYMNK
jgi:hypothetical protein